MNEIEFHKKIQKKIQKNKKQLRTKLAFDQRNKSMKTQRIANNIYGKKSLKNHQKRIGFFKKYHERKILLNQKYQ